MQEFSNQSFINQLVGSVPPADNKEEMDKTPITPKSPKMPTPEEVSNFYQFAEEKSGKLSSFSKDIMKDLPDSVKLCLKRYHKPRNKSLTSYFYQQLDVAILTILSIISSALPNFHFFYRKKFYFAPLMAIISARAGMGKGIMDDIFSLILPIHEQFKKRYEVDKKKYDEQQKRLLKCKNKKDFNEDLLDKPLHSFFRIPGDSTYAAFMKCLVQLNGMGILLETEIDVLINAFMSEMSNFSIFVRKNFGHESHSYQRKTDDEYCEIPLTRFAMAISGTLERLWVFINSVQDGFFSRFIYYFLMVKPRWIDDEGEEFEEDDKTFYYEKGKQLLKLFNMLDLRKDNPVSFKLTDKQRDKMNKNFATIHANYLANEGDDIHSPIVRLAIIFQRIAMILTITRVLDEPEDKWKDMLDAGFVCSNKDFNVAMKITMVLLDHLTFYYELINEVKAESDKEEENNADFGRDDVNDAYEALPNNKELSRQDILKIFAEHNVPNSTTEKYINKMLSNFHLHRKARNVYTKTSPKEMLISNNKKAKKAKKK